jgi:superfamily II DNA helicase RecQ
MPARTAAKPKSGRTAKAKSRHVVGQDNPSFNEGAFEALRKWRSQKAAAMGKVPAYIIYPDATLEALASRLPKTEAELLEVRGIGPAKAHRFGAETISVLRPFIAT